MSSTIGEAVNCLEQFAPTALAEAWDNVGLLVGNPSWPALRVMTCLTITPSTVAEAIDGRAELIVTHHPLPFRPLRSITTDTTAGRMLLELIAARIGVYSAHTAFDSAQAGINQHLAIGLGLQQIEPLIPASKEGLTDDVGRGRVGLVGEELTLREMTERVKSFLDMGDAPGGTQIVGSDDCLVSRVAIACGSGGSFLETAIEKKCDCLVTGEANFHTCLEAEARGVGLILSGHFASERFAMLSMADYLSEQLSDITVWASRTERNPLRSV